MVVCPERGAALHMAQLMPLPLTVSRFSTIEIGFYLSGTGSPGARVVPDRGPLNECVCVYIYVCSTTSVTRAEYRRSRSWGSSACLRHLPNSRLARRSASWSETAARHSPANSRSSPTTATRCRSQSRPRLHQQPHVH